MRYLLLLTLLGCEDIASEKLGDAVLGNVTSMSVGEDIQGDLSEGEILSDLDWAQNSAVACWPGNEHINFMGHHVFYSVSQEPHTLLTATVTPDSADVDVNVYILQQSEGNSQVPPAVTSVVTCEVGFPQSTDANPGEEDSARVTAIEKSYFNVVGVAGPEGAVSGGYTLSISSEPY